MKQSDFHANVSICLNPDAPHKVEIDFAMRREGNSWVTVWIGGHQLTVHGSADQVECIVRGLAGPSSFREMIPVRVFFRSVLKGDPRGQ